MRIAAAWSSDSHRHARRLAAQLRKLANADPHRPNPVRFGALRAQACLIVVRSIRGFVRWWPGSAEALVVGVAVVVGVADVPSHTMQQSRTPRLRSSPEGHQPGVGALA